MRPPVTAQLRATLPVKPPVGLIVMVDVPLGPGDTMVTAVLLRSSEHLCTVLIRILLPEPTESTLAAILSAQPPDKK
jgi:hypothetical protein